ncbi:dihydropteroate synthase [Glaciecola sp. 1036]|uniref:dihydropteroate synthase n=1 Tax=Alteromonadaceae TaxID=72275 RepID=UPI003CFD96C1
MTFGDKTITFDSPKIMGILNVTPDSFSDGGKFNQVDKALKQAEYMVDSGATFIDIGGESTRPGAAKVSLEQELERVIPVVEKIAQNLDCVISVDTSKAEVMLQAAKVGARLINDVRALSEDGALSAASKLAHEYQIPCCIMHMQGTPQTMQNKPEYSSVLEEVVAFLKQRVEELMNAGFKREQIILDPGFGFGKNLDHNYTMLKKFSVFKQFDMPLLAGMSRKSMIGNLLNREVNQRIAGDIATHTIAALYGANILRVHDVPEMKDAADIISKLDSL